MWNATTGEPVTAYREHTSWIDKGLVWSPDSTMLASSALDGTVRVWEAFSGVTRVVYRGHHSLVRSLTWSPDGKWLASGGSRPEASVQVWEALTGELTHALRDHMLNEKKERPLFGTYDDEIGERWAREASSVRSLSWSPDGQWLASSSSRWFCFIWDAATGERVQASGRSPEPIAWSPDSQFLISRETGRGIVCWEALTNQTMLVYNLRLFHLDAIQWSPDGASIAASSEGKIYVWKV